MDDNLAAKFETITRTILSNQTDALNTLTSKVTFTHKKNQPINTMLKLL